MVDWDGPPCWWTLHRDHLLGGLLRSIVRVDQGWRDQDSILGHPLGDEVVGLIRDNSIVTNAGCLSRLSGLVFIVVCVGNVGESWEPIRCKVLSVLSCETSLNFLGWDFERKVSMHCKVRLMFFSCLAGSVHFSPLCSVVVANCVWNSGIANIQP